MRSTRILVPTGHMGTVPFEVDSFRLGVQQEPDFVIADSGSADIGPTPLGADKPPSDPRWQEHDLEEMLLAARRLGVPMIVGSAADTGTDRGVDLYVDMVHRIAERHSLGPFKLTAIYSELSVEAVREMQRTRKIEGLNGRAPLTEEILERTDKIVAVMGAEPIRDALDDGADVIICGRASDPSIFAAALLSRGHDPSDAYMAGKILECASFCAEPFMGKESVIGTVRDASIDVTPMNPKQRCTPTSVAAHTMYERISPYRETVPGGYVDLTRCEYEQIHDRTTRVTGYKFVPQPYRVKLEGAGQVGARRIFIAGIRDPQTIEKIDVVIDMAKERLENRFGKIGKTYNVRYHTYGRDAVMGNRDPKRQHYKTHELGIIVDVISPDSELCEQICHIAAKSLFMARLPGIKGTAGTAAIFSDEIIRMEAAYDWTLNHVLDVERPDELMRRTSATVK